MGQMRKVRRDKAACQAGSVTGFGAFSMGQCDGYGRSKQASLPAFHDRTRGALGDAKRILGVKLPPTRAR